ncbi:MAG: DUF1893 domain-containing protein, partial [Candidatus Bathyarchaeota archaeon]
MEEKHKREKRRCTPTVRRGLSRYLEELERSGKNLLVFNGGEMIFSSGSRGIMPLIEAIDALGGSRLDDLVTADRIIGRAAA